MYTILVTYQITSGVGLPSTLQSNRAALPSTTIVFIRVCVNLGGVALRDTCSENNQEHLYTRENHQNLHNTWRNICIGFYITKT